ncbi:4'-phosphopantetheinyl transferase superfamily protein [Nonomuraea ferruginea]
MVAALFHGGRSLFSDDRMAEVGDMLRRPESMVSMARSLKATRGYRVRAALDRVSCPAMYLWGRHDRMTPVDPWLEVLAELPGQRDPARGGLRAHPDGRARRRVHRRADALRGPLFRGVGVSAGAALMGVDIVEVDRIARAARRGGDVFARRLTTAAERALGPGPAAFSVKESLIKAVGSLASRVHLARLRGRGPPAVRLERLPAGGGGRANWPPRPGCG